MVCSSKVVPLSSLSMVSMPAFNLSPLLDHLSSSMLMSLADLAGYMDSFNISSLLQHAYSEANMATDVKVNYRCEVFELFRVIWLRFGVATSTD